ncbi:hypothetical protein JDV02_008799 [Purpureocillium takamizusanense]|uniref:YhhN-like protein n=1 Tax=Purpureocillium takamizusanense TaxID=2060973 RepID=A0A9Q8VF30_9HYPO|nr:uncharacterized protein JDV02_008799 [Purpureocillium takamizusanense]UNI22956.1 hypothetical protein JDV02_008799 [Purpureocillium takamizusanense]
MTATATLNSITLERIVAADAAILAVSLSAALFYAAVLRATPSHTRMVSKASSTALLAVFAAVRNNGNGNAWLLVPALGLGALGDAFLAWPGEEAFLRGLASFLVAHLFYIALFMQAGHGTGQIMADGWRKGVATSMLALAPVMSFMLVPRVPRTLRAPIIVYSAVILAMVLSVLTIDNPQVVTGAVLFALSDSILSTDEFLMPPTSPVRPLLQHSVWVLYYSGQLLIASGL